MKSSEFLTEAESNLALKKLDKYLNMLSNDNLRGLIPMVKKSLNMTEADVQFGKRTPNTKPAFKSTPSPSLTAPTFNASAFTPPNLSNKSSEESKVAQAISSLSEEEKKELLFLLQKEAKSRPADKPASNQTSQKQTKKDDKGPGVLKGSLLPIAGIIGLLSFVAALPNPDEKSKSDSSSQTTQQVVSPAPQTTVTPTDTYTWAEPKSYWRHESREPGVEVYTITSNNQIDLTHHGKTQINMDVWYTDGKLKGVTFENKGQFYGGYIGVKFDDGPVKKYYYLEDSNYFFVDEYRSFVNNLKKSKKTKIEIGYNPNISYIAGRAKPQTLMQVFEFDTIGLSYTLEKKKKSSGSSISQSTTVVEPFTYGDGATYYTIKVKSSPTDPNVKIYLGKRDGRSGISYSIYAVDLRRGKGVKIANGFNTDFEDESSALSQFNNEIPLANSYELVPGSTQHIRYKLLKDKF